MAEEFNAHKHFFRACFRFSLQKTRTSRKFDLRHSIARLKKLNPGIPKIKTWPWYKEATTLIGQIHETH